MSTVQKQTNTHDKYEFLEKITKDVKQSIRKSNSAKNVEISDKQVRKELKDAKLKRDISIDSIVHNRF